MRGVQLLAAFLEVLVVDPFQDRLLDVEAGEHALEHLVGYAAPSAYPQHLVTLGLQHLRSQPRVGLARRLVLATEAFPDGVGTVDRAGWWEEKYSA